MLHTATQPSPLGNTAYEPEFSGNSFLWKSLLTLFTFAGRWGWGGISRKLDLMKWEQEEYLDLWGKTAGEEEKGVA